MKREKARRAIALILVILLAGGAVVGALISALAANAEEAQDALPLNRQELTIEYLEDAQALHITQRLVYTNASADALDGVVFYAAGNMFRRQSAMMYDAGDLAQVFSSDYAPAGIDLRNVRFEGQDADYGFQGEDELYIRVSCDLPAGASGAFEFEYYLLLMRCNAFQGVGETDVRASAFYFVPGVYDKRYSEFILKKPLAFARWLYCDAADFDVTLILPDTYVPAATGSEELEQSQDHRTTWRIRVEGAREFAVSFSKRWRAAEALSEGGVQVRTLTGSRGDSVARAAASAVSWCEEKFGAYPVRELDIAQSDILPGALNFPGVLWLPSALLEAGREAELNRTLRFAVAQQCFGMAAYADPSADAWMSDSLCNYLSYLMLEDMEGRDAFLAAVNRDWVSELQLTVPGGLTVTSDAQLFDGNSYAIVVCTRGAVVFHELRLAMGEDAMLAGLRAFYEMGTPRRTLTEMDLVAALNETSGTDWEAFLTDWVFNVGEYVNQRIDWFE